jgi:hypothetical protein
VPDRVSIGVDLYIGIIEAADSRHSPEILRFDEHGLSGS